MGEQAINEYALSEQETPAEWSKPGVSVPIGAFALGKPVNLPENVSKDICICIGNRRELELAQKKLQCDEKLRIESFRKKYDLPTASEEKLFLWFINSSGVQSYNIAVKFIATKIKRREK